MLIGDSAKACTYPYINVRDPSARVEHEASTSKIGDEQLFYMQQRGLETEEAVGMIISGFCREVRKRKTEREERQRDRARKTARERNREKERGERRISIGRPRYKQRKERKEHTDRNNTS
jgi:Fe-S cluster assembly scaffold protein SufB